MLQNRFERPLVLKIKSSVTGRYLKALLFLLCLLSILFYMDISFGYKLFLVSVLIIYFYYRNKFYTRKQITSLSLNSESELSVTLNKGRQVSVELYGECVVTSIITLLNFREVNNSSKKYHLVIFNDSLKGDELRLLRARLRFKNDTQVRSRGDLFHS